MQGLSLASLELRDAYEYKPLRGGSAIRRFVLVNGQDHEPIRGLMQHVSLEDKPVYTALSYVWGSNVRSRSILCEGCVLKITENLHSALLEIRRDLQDKGPNEAIPVWADSICIDQSKDEEVSQQISLMAEIYKYATRVTVWLGNASHDSELAMDFVLRLENTLHKLQASGNQQVIEAKNFEQFNLPDVNAPEWFALSSLLTRPWFTRIWVIQELAFGIDVTVRCGRKELEFDLFHNIIVFLTPHPVTLHRGVDGYDGPEAGKAMIIMNHIRNDITKLQRTDLTLLQLLRACSIFKATEAKDKIFALLGLAEDGSEVRRYVDYTHSTSRIYRRYAKYIAMKEDGIELICQVRYPKKTPLPSWVPDWRDRDDLPAHINGFQNCEFYAASGDSTPLMNVRTNTYILDVKGAFIDSLVRIGPWAKVEDNEAAGLKPIAKYDDNCRDLIKDIKTYPTGETVQEAFWRARIANQNMSNDVANSSMGGSYEAWKEYLDISIAKAGGAKVDEIRHAELDQKSDEFASAQRQYMPQRRLCVTRKGYLGLMPMTAKEEDLIAIVAGATVPFVFRKLEKDYMLVGQCFIHGIMEGQALKEKDFKWQNIAIV